MMPQPNEFASAMRKLGISDGATIVVYDGLGLFSAPRVWWMLKAFGARDVHVLDGGLPAWKAENRPLEDGDVIRAPSHFTARLDHSVLASLSDVQRALAADAQVLDARPAERFRGEVAEPRPGLRMGHIPGSKSLPFSLLLDNGRMKTPEQLKAVFEQAGVVAEKPIITSCGSGVSAAIITLSLTVAGQRAGALYDGSWAEWGKPDGPAIATGPAQG
jgi:thiosulfate/3-mercaptopyruvate sulfurtransferase